uniref:Myb/SANT-like domain-containing protein n=1 Tax=Tanacetum cinerariifolium TaxID=118510 RepID=A0A6L2J4P3_TANCI|nr:myb/SANT-like domain-containing protein [Tanacetum cinerariifolium]
MERSRSRSRKKCFWHESETQLLIQVLQVMACDPSWKTDTGFRSNYMCEVHRRILVKRPKFSKIVSPHIESKVKWLKSKFHAINDMLKQSGCSWNDIDKKIACEREWYLSYCKNHKDAQGLWDFEFPYFNQLELVYGRDRATSLVAEGYGDAIHNLEVEQNLESRGENIGFNTNFGKMANDVANFMTDANMREKAASEKLKDVLDELVKLDIPSGDVLQAGEIFAENKDKMDIFMNLSKPLRTSYVLKLIDGMNIFSSACY